MTSLQQQHAISHHNTTTNNHLFLSQSRPIAEHHFLVTYLCDSVQHVYLGYKICNFPVFDANIG